MKVLHRIVCALGLVIAGTTAQAATQFSEKDYSLYAGDFNEDGRTDLLYVGKTPDKPNGIALADSNGIPQIGFQSWPANYLGIPWSTGQFVPAIGDFNGDGQSDVLMQSATAGTSYLLLANSNSAVAPLGQLVGVNQAINQTLFGIAWSADQHKLHVGDFDGDGKDDVLLQATAKGGTNAIILADGGGGLFVRSTSYCWSGGPQQCWTDGEQGLDWSTKSAVLTLGKFNADYRADILYQARPNIVLIDYEIPIPVPAFKPSTFGIFLGQIADGSGKIIRTANQLWSKSDLGAQWSPINSIVLTGDFNGDGYQDVLLQSKSGSNLLLYANSAGVLSTAVSPAGNVASWNASSYNAIVGKFGNSAAHTLYLQGKDGPSNNYYTSNISAGSVMAYASNLALVAAVPMAPPTAIGSTPAAADVTQNGSAAYTIPILLPRGTAGLTPDLALTYSSNSGNGLVGVGWNISGLGIIARCPKTVAQDGVTQGVQLLATDAYCFNGNRLRLVTGTQGANGSVYRTELETYARVTAQGTGTQGPSWFKVETKDGLIYEYGNSSDSRVGVPGNASITRVWALSKVSDRAGNYWTVSYINEVSTNGSYRPEFIDYTTNPAAVPAAAPYRVKFQYEGRNVGENVVSYYGGGLIQTPQRLKSVELWTTGGGALTRKYTLTYETPATTFNVVSRVQSLVECSPTACMAPTIFTWSDMTQSGGVPAYGTDAAPNPYAVGPDEVTLYAYNAGNRRVADFNGDGILDTAYQLIFAPGTGGPTPPSDVYVQLGVRRGQPVPSPLIFPEGSSGYIFLNLVMDWDADGVEDLLASRNGTLWLLHRNGAGALVFDSLGLSLSSLFPSDGPGNPLMADVDGDGFRDIVRVRTSNGAFNGEVRVRFHRRDAIVGFEATESVVWTPSSGTKITSGVTESNTGETVFHNVISSADFDGDGLQDILVEQTTQWRILYSTGTGFSSGDVISFQIPGLAPTLLDMNGDGCTDIAYPSATSPYPMKLATSRCRVVSGVGLNAAVTLSVGNAIEDPSAVDVNGDGYQDLVWGFFGSGGYVAYSTGTTFAAPVTVPSAPYTGLNRMVDVDGDGLPDFSSVCDSATARGGFCDSENAVALLSTGTKGNLLLSATDGFGKLAKFTYMPMTDPGVYAVGARTSGKSQKVISPMYVAKMMTLSDGVGGYYERQFVYGGAKRHVAGRGSLGFDTREERDSRTGFVTRETYNNTVNDLNELWEYAGTLATRIIYQDRTGTFEAPTFGSKVEELVQQFQAIMPDGATNRRYLYLALSTVARYELASANSPTTTTTTTTQIDNYGTPYNVTTTTTEGVLGINPGSTVTAHRYTPLANILNDPANWCIARPQRLEDTRSHSMPGGAAITRVSTQVWDALKCRVTNTAVAPGSGYQLLTAIEYDSFGNVTKSTVTGDGIPAGSPVITQASFGTNGHLQQTAVNAKGHVVSFTWNVPLGFRTSVTDPNGLVTTWIPDDLGREKEMIRPDGTRTYKSYFNCTSANSFCGDGLVRYVVRTESRNSANDPNNLINYSDQFVDMMGREKYLQTRGFSGQTVVTETLYDNRGNVALKTNPHYAGGGSVSGVSTFYDNLNRVTQTSRSVSDGDRTVISEHVTYEGLKIRSFDANGRETTRTGNILGVVASATDEAGKSTSYTYNSFGELLSATDPANNVTTIHYIDSRGFKDYSDDPDMGHWSYTYDALGQVLTQTDAKSQTTTFAYDELGRSKTRIDHGGGATNTTTWTWDGPSGVASAYGIGQLKQVDAPNGYQEIYTYDNKGRRSTWTTTANGSTYAMDYAYDAGSGLLSTVTYPNSTGGSRVSVQYSYQNGFLKDAKDVSAGMALIWRASAQDARGHVIQAEFGNGLISSLGFDQTNGRLYTVQTGDSASTQNLAYSWDFVGNLTGRRDNTQGVVETFSYDSVYRLTSTQRNGTTTQTVSYDDIGNITSKSDVGAYVYAGAQAGCSYTGLTAQPHAVRKVGATVYCYDKNGNMMSRDGASVVWSTYNFPLTVNQAGGNTSTFYYGADRNRYRQVSVEGAVTEDRIAIAGGAFEKNVRTGGADPGTEYRHYVMANGQAVALITRAAANASPTTPLYAETYYLHGDHLGSTDVISKSAGAIHVRTSFDAWGQRRGSTLAGAPSASDVSAIARSTRKGFTGHEQLDNLNLIHMNGRVYDPSIARFISADPIIQDPYHSQSFNRYSYIWNNPLNGTDPTGFCKDSSTDESEHGTTKCNPDDQSGPKKGGGIVENGQGEGETTAATLSDASANTAQDLPNVDAQDAKKQVKFEENQETVDPLLEEGQMPSLEELFKQLPMPIVDSKGNIYHVSGEMYEDAVEYLRSVIPQQQAITGKFAHWEHFGRIRFSNGGNVAGYRSSHPDRLCYGGKGVPGACSAAIEKAEAKGAVAPTPMKTSSGLSPVYNVHLHPGSDSESGRFSQPDMAMGVGNNIPIFIGNMKGDVFVFPAGMPANLPGRGIQLCSGCAK